MAKYPDRFEQVLIHTGQHDDANIAQAFCGELALAVPDATRLLQHKGANSHYHDPCVPHIRHNGC